MTRIYSKVAATRNPNASATSLRASLGKFDCPDALCRDGWIRSDNAFDDETMWPLPASALPGGRVLRHSDSPRTAFILQRDPDGSWHLDRRNETAGAVRPVSAAQPCVHEAAPQNNPGTWFIIEFG